MPPSVLTVDETAVLQARLEVLERRITVVEEQERAEPWRSDGRPWFSDYMVKALHNSPGIVVDEGVARATPCVCLELTAGVAPDAAVEECFSKGVVGGLDEGQKALYCNPRVTREATPAQRQRIAVYQSCGRDVHTLPAGERLGPFFACIDKEMHVRGLAQET